MNNECCCNGNGELNSNCGCRSTEDTGIKVLGSGCKSCHALYENVKKVVESKDMVIDVEYVTDMEKVISYGVTSMPALVVNGKVVSQGEVLKDDEIRDIIELL